MLDAVRRNEESSEFCIGSRHQRDLHLFAPTGISERIVIEIFISLLWNKDGNQILVLTTDLYTKLTRAISVPKISSTPVAHIYLNQWVILYDILDPLLKENVQQFFRKLFISVCSYQATCKIRTTMYYFQSSVQVERYNWMLFSWLCL